MSETQLDTRIILRNDTLENWEANPDMILLKGEVALVAVPQMIDGVPNYNNVTYLLKAGDNKTEFSKLNWISANAADVFAWAKQSELPVNIANTGDVITEIMWDTETGGLNVIKDGAIMVQTVSDQESNYTPSGTITMPGLSVTQRIVSQNINIVEDVGSPISLSNSGSISKKADSKNLFNTNAVIAKVGNSGMESNSDIDEETIVFSPAAQIEGVTKVGEITYTPPQLTGSIPTFKEQTLVTSVEKPEVNYASTEIALKGTPVKISISKQP